MALSGEALEMARAVGDPEALITALQSRHAALLHVSHLDERLALDDEILALAGRISLRELESLGRHWRIYDLLEAGRMAEARAEHEALAELARQLRQPLHQHFALGWEVVWAQMSGRVAEAERLARQAHELGQRAQARDADTIYAAQMLTLRRREDRLAEYVSTVETFVERHPGAGRVARRPAAGPSPQRRARGGPGGVRGAGDGRLRRDPARHVLVHRRLRGLGGVRAARATRCAPARSTRCCSRTATGWSRSRRRRASGPPSASSGCSRQPSATSTRPSSTSRARWHKNAARGVLPLIPFIRVEFAQVLLRRGAARTGAGAARTGPARGRSGGHLPARGTRSANAHGPDPREPLGSAHHPVRTYRRVPRGDPDRWLHDPLADRPGRHGARLSRRRSLRRRGRAEAVEVRPRPRRRGAPALRSRGPDRPAHRPRARRPGARRRRARGHALPRPGLRARRDPGGQDRSRSGACRSPTR